MEVDSMRMKHGALFLVILAAFLAACSGATPTGNDYRNPDPASVATPQPTPTPVPTLVGLWKIANAGNLGPFDGYSVEISSHDTRTGEVRGRNVYKWKDLTGLLTGNVRPLDGGRLHVDWRVDYGGGDSENGSMDVDAARRRMDGTLYIELPSFNASYTINGVVLRRE